MRVNHWLIYMEQARSNARLADFFRQRCLNAIQLGDVRGAELLARWACRSRRSAILWAYSAGQAVGR